MIFNLLNRLRSISNFYGFRNTCQNVLYKVYLYLFYLKALKDFSLPHSLPGLFLSGHCSFADEICKCPSSSHSNPHPVTTQPFLQLQAPMLLDSLCVLHSIHINARFFAIFSVVCIYLVFLCHMVTIWVSVGVV